MTKKRENKVPLEPVAQEMICSTCGYGLENYEQWTNGIFQKVTYQHGYLPPGVDPDHKIVPIPRPDNTLEIKGVCDFCMAPDPIWTYPAKSFHTDIAEQHKPGEVYTSSYGSVGDWGACQQCYEDIEADNWDAMVERNLKLSPERMIEPIRTLLKLKIMDAWKGFRLNRTGPAYLEADGPPQRPPQAGP